MLGKLCEESNSVHIHTERSFVWGSGLVPGLGLGGKNRCVRHATTHVHTHKHTHVCTHRLSIEDCGLLTVESVENSLLLLLFPVNRCLFKHVSWKATEFYNPVGSHETKLELLRM